MMPHALHAIPIQTEVSRAFARSQPLLARSGRFPPCGRPTSARKQPVPRTFGGFAASGGCRSARAASFALSRVATPRSRSAAPARTTTPGRQSRLPENSLASAGEQLGWRSIPDRVHGQDIPAASCVALRRVTSASSWIPDRCYRLDQDIPRLARRPTASPPFRRRRRLRRTPWVSSRCKGRQAGGLSSLAATGKLRPSRRIPLNAGSGSNRSPAGSLAR